MTRQIIHTGDAPASPAYSQAVKAGNTVYVAGTPGVDVTTGEFADPTAKDQVERRPGRPAHPGEPCLGQPRGEPCLAGLCAEAEADRLGH